MMHKVSVTAGRAQRHDGRIELELDVPNKTDAMIAVGRWLDSPEGQAELNRFSDPNDRSYIAIHME